MKYTVYGYADKDVIRASLTHERYAAIRQAKKACLFGLELEEKFTLVVDNFAEFEMELLRLAETYLLWGYRGDHTESMQSRLCLDRRLVNLLTACRLYLDQTDHGISALFGKASPELAGVKAFKRCLYEGHWGYRLMEAMRNHVQHSGLIVHSIGFPKSQTAGKGVDYTEFTICPQALVQKLSEDADFKKSVLGELESKGKKIDLRGPVREYLSCFVELHDKLREVIQERMTQARAMYEAAVKEFQDIEGKKVQFVSLLEAHDDDRKSEDVDLVTDFLEYYDTLREKNQVNRNIERATASNSDQQRGQRPP
jgi:hypothetical protein